MHDVLEGVAKFGIIAIIDFYFKNKTFTLDYLNRRIRLFPFHKLSNKPPPITPNMLSNRDLAVSAAENMNLVIYFCLLVGDYVCETCNVWKYYLSLKDLVDFILMKSFSIRQIPQLESIIAELNSLYMTTFKTNLKPKHHFLIHYPSCILQTGPISLNWSMRFESKHCLLKLISNVTKSRVNLCKTIMDNWEILSALDVLRKRCQNLLS